jgi:hypothetical protein
LCAALSGETEEAWCCRNILWSQKDWIVRNKTNRWVMVLSAENEAARHRNHIRDDSRL